ncbi:MAG: radical SAM protein [Alphaproteobacteria bacterium]|nr:radical SAM protein [Alphaproteobacteria bacterium]
MPTEAALPSRVWSRSGSILTFVVPAPNGCNLDCPFCFVKQRAEDAVGTTLSAYEYSQFIRTAAEAPTPITAVSIQGYEPLLPESFAYTKAILATARWLRIPTSLVTNGTHLAERVDDLRVLTPSNVMVSLDAASAEAHDRQRRKPGAFASAVDGLRKAATGLPATTELVVTSVLMPKRRAQLDAMPALLQDLGIKRWVVTALVNLPDDRIGGPVGERETVLADLRVLSERARRAGIDFRVDDEFDGLASGGMPDEFEKNRIRRLVNPEGVYRLVPDGRCSKGADILKPLTEKTPRWDPKTDAAAFLASL